MEPILRIGLSEDNWGTFPWVRSDSGEEGRLYSNRLWMFPDDQGEFPELEAYKGGNACVVAIDVHT